MKKLPQHVWLCVLLLPLLASGSKAQSSKEPPSDWTITLDVEQVLLTVAVRDRAGRHVPDLEESAFRVYEDGKRQRLDYFSRQDIPVTVGLLVDNSRSMRSKHSEVLAAALAFVHGSNPGDEMFVVNFNERVRFGLPNSLPFTADPQLLRQALVSVVLDGQTALYDAIGLGLDHLEQGSRDKEVLLVISDGGDNASRLKLKELLARIERTSALIYTVGVYDDANVERNLPALKKIARASGGAAYFPSRVADMAGVCKEIANDIRSQYTIAYKSANSSDDVSFRRIRVTAKSPEGRKLRVRTRPGYSRKLAP
jgi:VWFA-related protein